MATTVLIGIQWGDEGKGKIIDVLTENADMVVRFQGGNNAGHTVEIGDDTFVLHLIPSGIFREQAQCVIGNGVVVDPLVLVEEMAGLEARGVKFDGRLEISTRSHLIFKYHRALDGLRESLCSEGTKIGTTKRGIGPAYSDKAARCGIRAVEMLDTKRFEARFRQQAAYYNTIFQGYKLDPLDVDAEWELVKKAAARLIPFVKDTVLSVNRAAKAGKCLFFEGAQGMLLDVDYGTYPFVTSSNTTSGGACTGSGLSPKYIDQVVGVMKAYSTRVGEGPFPTELDGDPQGAKLRKVGNEFGATTGRPRRCGWFDAVSCRYSCMVNGVDKLAITKLDVLDSFEELKVCVAYEVDGVKLADMPSDTDDIIKAKPVYETLPGWNTSTRDARSFKQLPPAAQAYLTYIAKLVDAQIGIVSVGPNRSQTFYV